MMTFWRACNESCRYICALSSVRRLLSRPSLWIVVAGCIKATRRLDCLGVHALAKISLHPAFQGLAFTVGGLLHLSLFVPA